ncbi:MAG: M20 family metallo-hydrolase [Deltaproteobacteria bacterium]|nr:M20 family metallo-hydrolase [Deltaproteobacteria bacterium]
MSGLKEVMNLIEGYRDEIIELQAELTSRIAVGPGNNGPGEIEKAEYLKQRLYEMSPKWIEEIKSPDGRMDSGYRPNIAAFWQGDYGSRTVWILSHLDVVPPGDISLWDTDPYQVRVDNDRIIGRGVEDNQHGIVSSLIAIKAIKESGSVLNRSVGLMFVSDEETGSKHGLEYLLKNRRELFNQDDLIIVPDAGNEEGTMIEVAEKSILHIKFTVTGKQCHASTPDKGKNSLFGAAKLMVALEHLKSKFDISNELFSPSVSTFESTKILANVPNINTIPGKDIFYMDCRVLPEYDVGEVLREVDEITRKVEEEQGVSIITETEYRLDAAPPTSAESSVVKELKKAIKAVSGMEGKPKGIGGGTVAALFREAGLPAAVWMTASDTAHQPNEYCLISNIMADAKVFSYIFLYE